MLIDRMLRGVYVYVHESILFPHSVEYVPIEMKCSIHTSALPFNDIFTVYSTFCK